MNMSLGLMIGLATLCVMLGGCDSKPTSSAAEGVAQPVTTASWPDQFNNIFTDGNYYFAGQPTAEGLSLLRDAGVKKVINIRTLGEVEKLDYNEPKAVADAGMSYVSIPISPKTFSAANVERFAAALEQYEEPVLVHCGSSNRVGGLWAAYLVLKRGVEVEKAMEMGRAAGMSSDGVEASVRRVIAE